MTKIAVETGRAPSLQGKWQFVGLRRGPNRRRAQVKGFAFCKRFMHIRAQFGLGEIVRQRSFLLGKEEALHELVFRELQVDALRPGVDALHRVAVAGGAAARGDDHIVQGQNLAQGSVLQRPERRLPVLLEKQGNRRMVFLLDVEVEVYEVHTEPLGKASADGALAGTGESDEDDGHFGLRFLVYGLRFTVYGLRFTVYGLGFWV